MNSRLAGLGILVLVLASATAQAEVSATVTATTDYDFRGITQTGLDPAFQASLDWSGESGLYASLWGSNIDFGNTDQGSTQNVEVDLVLGYSGSFTEDFGYDVGGTYYEYLGGNTNVPDVNYYEIRAGLNYTKHASTTFWYAPDYSNSSSSAWYGEVNGDIPLPWWDLGVALHLGYSGGDYWKNADLGGDQFYDFSVGLTRSFGHFDFAVKYADGSDNKDLDCSRSSVECGGDAIFSSQSVVIFTVSTTFPWTKAEETKTNE